MKIEKAIEVLSHLGDPTEIQSTEDISKAIKLGMEALRLIHELRYGGQFNGWKLLPGETKE